MTTNWKKKLTKAELKHLRDDAGVRDLAGLKRTLREHADRRTRSEIEPCWICRGIGRKLDLDDRPPELQTIMKRLYGNGWTWELPSEEELAESEELHRREERRSALTWLFLWNKETNNDLP